jgi:hypothetical protein
MDEKQEVALRTLFGKLRVTYTTSTVTTDLNGEARTDQYEVLGKDKHSVAVREFSSKQSPLDGVLELSEFTVIQFDGPDSYWVITKVGDIREYFKRVK